MLIAMLILKFLLTLIKITFDIYLQRIDQLFVVDTNAHKSSGVDLHTYRSDELSIFVYAAIGGCPLICDKLRKIKSCE